MPNTLDMDSFVGGGGHVVLKNLPKEDPKDASLRRLKDATVFFVTLTMFVIIFFFCGYAIVSKDFNPDFKKFAIGIDMSIGTSLVSYFLGKNSAQS